MLNKLTIKGVDEQLKQAIIASLVCRKARTNQDVFEGKAGWWADYLDEDDEKLGSYLWTLERSILSEDTLEEAKRYALECLEWVKETGKIKSIEVIAVAQQGRLNLEILCS